MEPVEQLLNLRFWEKRPEAWQKLTVGDTLFRTLHQLVREAMLPVETMRWVTACENLVEDQKSRRQWNLARALVWCAQQAAAHPDFYRTEIDRVCFALTELPDFIEGREKWAWGCIRSFLGAPTRGKAIEVPIALVDTTTNRGFIARLALEILAPGAGQIFHYPADALTTFFDQGFESSIEAAWAAAKALAQQAGINGLHDGCWQLMNPDGETLPQVGGGSASGAAAWGWHCALTGKVYDPRVIMLAEIDSSGVLSKIDGEEAKTRAIAKDKRFDTIVVASTENKNKVVDTLLGGRNADQNLRKEAPSEQSPGSKYYVTLTDGRVMKVVNLDVSGA